MIFKNTEFNTVYPKPCNQKELLRQNPNIDLFFISNSAFSGSKLNWNRNTESRQEIIAMLPAVYEMGWQEKLTILLTYLSLSLPYSIP